MEVIWSILKQALTITGFVITMMLIIDYVNVLSQGKLLVKLKNKRGAQIIAGTLLGLIPGCLGTFTVVSMYTHRLLSFGALTAAMIATSGDETFLMFAIIPDKVWIIMLILAALAISVGFITDKLMGKRDFISAKKFSFEVHSQDHKECIIDNLKLFNFRFSLLRIASLLLLGFFIIAPIIGLTKHEHNVLMPKVEVQEPHQHTDDCNHPQSDHNHATESSPNHENHNHGKFDWFSITLIITASIGFFICLTCSEHFLRDHMLKHLIIKHLPKIFLWTIIALILIHIFLMFTDIHLWINNNLWLVLLIAVFVGIIPESGPHILFLSLYISGTIPLSILIANSIVQDGHGALPLFAESKRSFVAAKSINLIVGLIIGSIGILSGL
ncbi:MAG TPA: putative manganese transporter [Bacteroidales bacterium]|nr:putative manganese transporter [Bacteroidales bacterium]